MKKEIRIETPAPNDCHVHLRRGKMLQKVLPFHNIFGNVIVMGNTEPENIVTAEDSIEYHGEIMAEKPEFTPHMTIMFVRKTTTKTIDQAYKSGIRLIKYIPEATSTGSEKGKGIPLWMLEEFYPVIDRICKKKMHFLTHIELAIDPATGKTIHWIDRERMGIPYLKKLIQAFPGLKITVEHVSTAEMVKFVDEAPDIVGAKITSHHIGPYYNLNVFGCDMEALRKGEIKEPDIFCLPILKSVDDASAVIKAMTSGNPKYMFGSDSAPHPPESKKLPNPKPGIFSAPTALSWISAVFYTHTDMNTKLLRAFLHDNSCQWYGFPKSERKIIIEKKKWKVLKNYKGIIPFLAEEKLYFKISKA